MRLSTTSSTPCNDSISSLLLRTRTSRQQSVSCVRRRTKTTTTSTTSTATNKQSTTEYLKEANDTMSHYSHARQLYRMGKIQRLPTPKFAIPFQAVILGVFLILFASTPFLGKKIATDKEFRQKYIPSWYDCTVKQPEHAWTRDELHAQLLAVQSELSKRAQRGEFDDHKLTSLEQSLVGGTDNTAAGTTSTEKKSHPKHWDRLHPGLAEGESYNEA